jgi:hypothetical protein
MKWIFTIAALAVLSSPALAERRALLHDPVALNIGVNCSWQPRCMAAQRRAMKASLDFVAYRRPPHRLLRLCNRNASHGGFRMDWVGFDHCIRNQKLRSGTVRSAKKRRR